MNKKQFDTKDFKKNVSTYIILGLALGAMLFFGVCNPNSFVEQLDNVAGSVASEDITQAEFSRAYSSENERARQRSGEADPQIAKQVLDSLITTRIMYLEAKKLGIFVSDDTIISYLNEIGAFRDADGDFSEEIFRNFLRGNRYSEETFMAEMKRNLSVDRLRQLLVNTIYIPQGRVEYDYLLSESKMTIDYIKVDPTKIPVKIPKPEVDSFMNDEANKESIENYYDSHQSQYKVPEKVHARHILVSFKDARNASGDAKKRSKEDAKKRAEALLLKVKNNPSQFVDIAKKETDERNGKSSGGDLGSFTRDAMVKEFSDAAFALESGQISDLVESPFGFHIIQNVKKIPVIDKSLDEVKVEIAEKLIKESKVKSLAKEKAEEVQKKLLNKEPVDALMKSIGAEWKKTDFPFNASYVTDFGGNPVTIGKLLALKEKGEYLEKPIEVQNKFFIVKLQSREIADLSKLDKQKRDQMVQNLRYRIGYGSIQEFQNKARQTYEERDEIYMNPQYLAIGSETSS